MDRNFTHSHFFFLTSGKDRQFLPGARSRVRDAHHHGWRQDIPAHQRRRGRVRAPQGGQGPVQAGPHPPADVQVPGRAVQDRGRRQGQGPREVGWRKEIIQNNKFPSHVE